MLVELAEARLETAGGKAAGLRRLLEAGLPVPPGLCLPFELYREAAGGPLPGPCAELAEADRAAEPVRARLRAWRPGPALERALAGSLRSLAAPSLVVRSSASCEDLDQPSAGLFVSTTGVRDLEGLLAAIRACWLSLFDLPAWAGLRLGGRSPGSEAMAVILQREVPARWAGLLLSRDPAEPARVRIEAVPRAGEGLASGEQDPQVLLLDRAGGLPAAALPAELLGFLREAALRLELELGTVVELEWAFDGDRPWLLQLRPSRAGAPPRSFPLVWPGEREAAALWRWDREHNPDPLSPAHASLIALIEARRPGPRRLLVQGGYLYTRAGLEEPPPEEPLPAIWEELGRALDREIAELEQGPADARARLERVLELFLGFHERYAGPLAGALRQARLELRRFLAELGAASEEGALVATPGHSSIGRTEDLSRLAGALRSDPGALEALAAPGASLRAISPVLQQWLDRHLARYGSLSRVWDLASPTFAEQPELLLPRLASLARLEESPLLTAARAERRAADRAAELAAGLHPHRQARLYQLLESAKLARRLEEDDDLLFARALHELRRALLVAGAELLRRGWLARREEVFLLSIPEVLASLERDRPGIDLVEETRRRARALEASSQLQPPLTIQGEQLTWLPPPGRAVLHGAGVGGVARGRVRLARRLEDLLGLDTHGAVVVCPTLLPSLALVIAEAAALVTDHGGLLSHAASLARELGVPAVVGTGTATRDLREGERVWVDGSRGTVTREVP